MPRGARFPNRSLRTTDPFTGAQVTRVTGFPEVTLHLHYETPTFTPDGKRMLVVRRRDTRVFDLISLTIDGDDAVQLSDDPAGMSSACMTPDGRYALYMEGGTCHRTDLATAEDTELGNIEGGTLHPYYRGMRSYDGRWFFPMVRRGEKILLVRWDVETGDHVIVSEADAFNHPKASPGTPEIGISAKHNRPDGSVAVEKLAFHCETLEPMDLNFPVSLYGVAHAFWLGGTGDYQCCSRWPNHALYIMRKGKSKLEVIATGPYFWHSGASLDGRWVIADTNFPDRGLWLVNTETKKKDRLCWSWSSMGYGQETHPHPNLSDDGRLAVFGSDASGVAQPYVAVVPDEMRERLSTPD